MKILILILLATISLSAQEKQTAKEYSLSTELSGLYDLGGLPTYRENTKSLQVSSYDRTGGNNDGFEGTYSFIRRNADSTLVIFESKGRGIIDRIWTPTPNEDTLDFYLGDSSRVSFSIKFSDLFSGKIYPFIPPVCGNEVGGYYSYLPIPFNKGCKIVSRGKTIRFLQIQYREWKNHNQVKSFSMDLNPDEKELLNRVVSVWEGKEAIDFSGASMVETEVSLRPGETVEVFRSKKGGRILGIEIENARLFEGNKNSIDIRMTWDNEMYPAIYAPLTDFFGFAFGQVSMQSMIAGTKNNTSYCYLPMPFDKQATIELISRDKSKELHFKTRVFYSEEKRDKKREGKLYVEWNRLLKSEEGVPLQMAHVTGKGHYVGTIMQTQNLEPGMTLFFEGDDMAVVDGEMTIHGTGSEDYFNGGWYAFLDTWDGPMSLPVHGSLGYSLAYGRTGGYRWHLNDKISFNKSISYSMEHGPEGNKEPVTNTTLGFYYCNNPKQQITEPSSMLSEVYVPNTFMLYPQTMKLNLWIDVDMNTEWCSPTGGYTYIFSVSDDSKIRVSLEKIPAGTYRFYLDYKEMPEGCNISFWQRQNQVSEEINTYAPKKNRNERRYLCDLEISKATNSLTFRFTTEPEKNKFLLNRLIFERIEQEAH